MPIDALQGNHVLVLGGSAGIGLATAEYLVRSGAEVVLAARGEERLVRARETLRAATGVRVGIVRADARVPADVEAAVGAVTGELGGVFVVAGTAGYRSVLDTTVETVREEFEDNVYPVVNAIRYAAPRMTGAGGSIVAVSSVAAVLSSFGIAGYGAAKAALEQYVRFAADELGEHGIRVNAVRPGLTRSAEAGGQLDERYRAHFRAITPLGDHGLPEDFAAMVSLLLSRESRWITGQTFAIDGGFGLRGHGGGSAVVAEKARQRS